MMFRGTDRYPDYDGETTKIGAFRNGTTNSDWTLYYVVANSGYLDKVMDIEADRLQNLKYTERDFRTDAGAVLGEQQQGAREPQRILDEKVRETAFTRHPYGHTAIGYEADVRAMPDGYAYSQEFYRRHYRPENVVVVLAGDFDSAAAKALVRKYYGGWARGNVARPPIPAEPPQTEPRRTTVTYPGRTLPIISISHRAPAWTPGDRTGSGAPSARAGRFRTELAALQETGAAGAPRADARVVLRPAARSVSGHRAGHGEPTRRRRCGGGRARRGDREVSRHAGGAGKARRHQAQRAVRIPDGAGIGAGRGVRPRSVPGQTPDDWSRSRTTSARSRR